MWVMPATRRCGGGAEPVTMSGDGGYAAAPNTAQVAQNATGMLKKFLDQGIRLLSGVPDDRGGVASNSERRADAGGCQLCQEGESLVAVRLAAARPGKPSLEIEFGGRAARTAALTGASAPSKGASAAIGDGQEPARKRPPLSKVLPGRSFAERFPETAAEWHPTLNGDLTPDEVGFASNRRAWWLCAACAHEWSASHQ